MNEPPKNFEEWKGQKALAYLHERIDQLIRQAGIEVGLLELKVYMGGAWAPNDKVYELAKARFWAADDAAADNHGQPHRER